MTRYNITVKENPFDGCPYADMVVSDDGAYMRYDDAKRALDAERADNAMAREAYWATIADLRSELATLQAQLRQVEGASVPRSRYDALNKDWLEEKESARRLKEVLAQLCLEMECSRNSMFVQMAVNVRATLAAKDAGNVCTNHFSDGSKIFPSRHCECKPHPTEERHD